LLFAVYRGSSVGVAWLPSLSCLCGMQVRFAEAIGLKILLLLQTVQYQEQTHLHRAISRIVMRRSINCLWLEPYRFAALASFS
jgi:hypothetical protein